MPVKIEADDHLAQRGEDVRADDFNRICKSSAGPLGFPNDEEQSDHKDRQRRDHNPDH